MAAFFSQQIFIGGLHFTADGFRVVYGLIALWMWAFTTLFSFEYFEHEREHLKRYWFFTILTFLATEGVMFSADLMTSFVFFEILSLTSFTWVIHEETPEAVRAAKTYFFIAIIGGLILFMGLALMSYTVGTLDYNGLHEAIQASRNPKLTFAAGICILLGFGAKAGMFPLQIWLPKAHPVAPSPASALLSGILTKVGVFGILMTAVPGFLGNARFGLIVILAGTITMALGAVIALFSVNLKRTLACSSMSQIGFILVGVGTVVLISALAGAEGEAGVLSEEAMELAHSGLVLHMVNHSLIKLTLFMAAGVFVMRLHLLNLNDIRGYGRRKPILLIPFALGALGISGVPLFSGYISKTLLHEGLVAAREALAEPGAGSFAILPMQAASMSSLLHVIEWIFIISGGFTFAYMLKLFICIFVEKHPEKQAAYHAAPPCMNRLSSATLLISSLLMPILGQPAVAGRLAAVMTGDHTFEHFHAFAGVNLKGGAISLAIGACIYLVIVRKLLMKENCYVNRWPEKLDLEDLIYRPLLLEILPGIGGALARFVDRLPDAAKVIMPVGKAITRFLALLPDGIMIFSRSTVLHERNRLSEEVHPNQLQTLTKREEQAAAPVVINFSFAIMMTCLGILIVFGVILFVYL